MGRVKKNRSMGIALNIHAVGTHVNSYTFIHLKEEEEERARLLLPFSCRDDGGRSSVACFYTLQKAKLVFDSTHSLPNCFPRAI